MKALIIAAGFGNRLGKFSNKFPKPLCKVGGITLIERAILSAKKAGITDFVIVTGYRGDQLEEYLSKRRSRMGVRIEFVRNHDWTKANGHSVLMSQKWIQEDFVLLMADHVFDYKILSDLLRKRPQPGEVILAVDGRVGEIFDLADATKVKTLNGNIVKIGKNLQDYDAIDTGIFYCSGGTAEGIFSALEMVCREGQGSLSEAMALLASQGKARTFRIGNNFWQDVDTPESRKEAGRLLFRSLRKETDGVISRHFNRWVSTFITRGLIKTPISPNQVTWSGLVVGLLAGFLVSHGLPRDVAMGGLLFQFASIYDGCDGEMAKLKMTSSRFGEWLDTVCDNVTYVAFFIGVILGVHHQGGPAVPLGLMALFGIFMTLGIMYFYLLKFTNSGSLVTVQRDLVQDMEAHAQNFLVRFMTKAKFIMKRDFFALLFMFLCLFNKLDWVLILTVIGSNVSWIVLLTMKREFVQAKAGLSENN